MKNIIICILYVVILVLYIRNVFEVADLQQQNLKLQYSTIKKERDIESMQEENKLHRKTIHALKSKIDELEKEKYNIINNKSIPMICTAYDLSVQSCGKERTHPAYGITRNGTNLKGKTRSDAMSIAVDPNIIPLGTKVYIQFPEKYKHFNGIYIANDTGSAIKGNHIDLYYGENVTRECMQFGVQNVKITILGGI